MDPPADGDLDQEDLEKLTVDQLFDRLKELVLSGSGSKAELVARLQDYAVALRFAEAHRKLYPARLAHIMVTTFDAVKKDDTVKLAKVLQCVRWDVWSRWRNARGVDILELSQERGSQGAGSLIMEAWRNAAWASVRGWASVHALVAAGRAFPRHCASLDEEEEPRREPPAYLVDDSAVKSGARGVAYRRSKDIEDRCEDRACAEYDSIVFGVEESGGWVRVGDRFLPLQVKGSTVLKLLEPQEVARLREERKDAAFGPLSELIVLLPADLLGLVLQYAQQGGRDMTRPRRLRRRELA